MSESNRPESSQLGKDSPYPDRYDAGLLFPIPRMQARAELGIDARALPFVGHDLWNAYELGWLGRQGMPQVAVAQFRIPADSPHLIESKSFKLYLNSLNQTHFDTAEALRACVIADLSAAAGAPVGMHFGLPPLQADTAGAVNLDALEVAIDHHGPPDATLLQAGDEQVQETLRSGLFKSNCPVTGQPDWASVRLRYRGPRIGRAGLLRYLVSFRDHRGFHEQCVERIFIDVMARCAPASLSVEARFTRRGGLDINPWRATPDMPEPAPGRDLRQ